MSINTGRYIGGSSIPQTGLKLWLDVFMVYNVGLTLAQLTQIYNVYRGRFDV
jgi:hypothetical protein